MPRPHEMNHPSISNYKSTSLRTARTIRIEWATLLTNDLTESTHSALDAAWNIRTERRLDYVD
eukprot:scaffold214954_cov35-Attheya_sp.AAC.1